jgi:hypothetical protein
MMIDLVYETYTSKRILKMNYSSDQIVSELRVVLDALPFFFKYAQRCSEEEAEFVNTFVSVSQKHFKKLNHEQSLVTSVAFILYH